MHESSLSYYLAAAPPPRTHAIKRAHLCKQASQRRALTYVIHALVDDERQRTHATHRYTLLVAQTRLLDVHIQVAHGVDNAQGVVHLPAGVCVAQQGDVQIRLAFLSQLGSLWAHTSYG